MIVLSQLKQTIVERRVVSLEELAKQFDRSPEVISGMLEHWQRKQVIRKLEPSVEQDLPCQQCRGCQQASAVFYQAL